MTKETNERLHPDGIGIANHSERKTDWLFDAGELIAIASPLDMAVAEDNLYEALDRYGLSPTNDCMVMGGTSGQDPTVTILGPARRAAPYRYLCEYELGGGCYAGPGRDERELVWCRDFKALHGYLGEAAGLIGLIEKVSARSERKRQSRGAEKSSVFPAGSKRHRFRRPMKDIQATFQFIAHCHSRFDDELRESKRKGDLENNSAISHTMLMLRDIGRFILDIDPGDDGNPFGGPIDY
jgi:hypothetical protein